MRTKRTERKTTPKGTTSKFFTVYYLQLYHGITAGSCPNSKFVVLNLCCSSCTMVSLLVPAAIRNLLCQTCAAPVVPWYHCWFLLQFRICCAKPMLHQPCMLAYRACSHCASLIWLHQVQLHAKQLCHATPPLSVELCLAPKLTATGH